MRLPVSKNDSSAIESRAISDCWAPTVKCHKRLPCHFSIFARCFLFLKSLCIRIHWHYDLIFYLFNLIGDKIAIDLNFCFSLTSECFSDSLAFTKQDKVMCMSSKLFLACFIVIGLWPDLLTPQQWWTKQSTSAEETNVFILFRRAIGFEGGIICLQSLKATREPNINLKGHTNKRLQK